MADIPGRMEFSPFPIESQYRLQSQSRYGCEKWPGGSIVANHGLLFRISATENTHWPGRSIERALSHERQRLYGLSGQGLQMGFRVRFAILFGSMLVSMGSAGTLELKLREGDGRERITVPTDSLSKNLIEVTLALDGASESLYEKTGNPLRDECMCEAPSDTLDITDGRGNTRK